MELEAPPLRHESNTDLAQQQLSRNLSHISDKRLTQDRNLSQKKYDKVMAPDGVKSTKKK